MAKDFRALFAQILPISLPSGLDRAVLARIEKEQIKRAKTSLFIFGVADILSLTSLVALSVYFVGLLSQSGFIGYLSLIFSDSQSLTTLWQTLGLSLIESLPVISLVALLTVTIVFVLSLAKTIVNARSILSVA